MFWKEKTWKQFFFKQRWSKIYDLVASFCIEQKGFLSKQKRHGINYRFEPSQKKAHKHTREINLFFPRFCSFFKACHFYVISNKKTLTLNYEYVYPWLSLIKTRFIKPVCIKFHSDAWNGRFKISAIECQAIFQFYQSVMNSPKLHVFY